MASQIIYQYVQPHRTLRMHCCCKASRTGPMRCGLGSYRDTAQQRARLTSRHVNAAAGLSQLSASPPAACATNGPSGLPDESYPQRQPTAAPPPRHQSPRDASGTNSSPLQPPLPHGTDGDNSQVQGVGAPAERQRQRDGQQRRRQPDRSQPNAPADPTNPTSFQRRPPPERQRPPRSPKQPPHAAAAAAQVQSGSQRPDEGPAAQEANRAQPRRQPQQPQAGAQAPAQQAGTQPQPQPPACYGYFAAQFPRRVVDRWRRLAPKQLTASLYDSATLPHLLAQLEVVTATATTAVAGEHRAPLNARQLCAAFTAAEHIAARESVTAAAGFSAPAAYLGGRRRAVAGGGGDGPGPSPRQPAVPAGLLAPPCRALTAREAAALAAVLTAHSEVLADADPPELATTLWAAARLRLRLPPGALEPALEAIWMWDPADPTVNHQDTRFLQRSGDDVVGGGSAAAAAAAARRSRAADRDVMGPWEVCLLLYAVSVLWPEYVQQNAGGFLEALDSYETAAVASRRQAGRGGGGGGGGGGLSREQVVGVVTALARADAPLDEVEEEFVLQAVSSRLRAFSLPHLTALLSAAHAWAPLRRSLHGALLGALLATLDARHAAFMERRRVDREQQQERQQQQQQQQRQMSQPGEDGETNPDPGRDGGAAASGPPAAAAATATAIATATATTAEDDNAAVVRALIAALRSGCDPPGNGGNSSGAGVGDRGGGGVSGHLPQMPSPPPPRSPLTSRQLSGLMRQVRLRAGTGAFSGRDVAEALRAMAALAASPAVRPEMVVRWKEGVRGLLRRWVELLRQEEASLGAAMAGAAEEEQAGRAVLSNRRAAAARTFATSLHAISRLGIRLQRPEAEVAAAAAASLVPYMGHMADCVMVLTALSDTLTVEAAGAPPPPTAAQQEEEGEGEDEVDEAAEGPTEGGGWRWLPGDGVRRLSPRGRVAAQLVLERAAELLRQQQTQGAVEAGAAGPGELVCLIRAAASLGAWPPEGWWRVWRVAAAAALPRELQPAAAVAVSTAPPPMSPRTTAQQQQQCCFSLAEAVDVLYSLARLENLRSGVAALGRDADAAAAAPAAGSAAAAARRRWRRRRGRLWSLTGGGGAAAAAAAVGSAPLGREVLTALLTVACLGPSQPRRRQHSSFAAAAGATSAAPAGEVGAMSVYNLAWAVARLQLFAPPEVALWGPRLTAAAPRALARLTPRKQVLMLRSLNRALRGAVTSRPSAAASAGATSPLPPSLAAAWLAAFGVSLRRARGQTLSYAAAAMAAARISPPAEWLARFRAAVRGRLSELSMREVAALVAGLGLHRRQPQPQTLQSQLLQFGFEPQPQFGRQLQVHGQQPDGAGGGRLWRRPLSYDETYDEWGNTGLARVLLRVLGRKLAASAPSARRPLGGTGADEAEGARSTTATAASPATAAAPRAAAPPSAASAAGHRPLPQPKAPSRSQRLSEADRQLARRLCFLLSRGAAACVPAPAQPPLQPHPHQQQEQHIYLPGAWSGQAGRAAREGTAAEEAEGSGSSNRGINAGEDNVGVCHGVTQPGDTGTAGSASGGGGGGGGAGRPVLLAPRPLLVIHQRGQRGGREFRLP